MVFSLLYIFNHFEIVFPKSSNQSVWSDIAHNMVDTSQDISISRSKSRSDWGIHVPGDNEQIVSSVCKRKRDFLSKFHTF